MILTEKERRFTTQKGHLVKSPSGKRLLRAIFIEMCRLKTYVFQYSRLLSMLVLVIFGFTPIFSQSSPSPIPQGKQFVGIEISGKGSHSELIRNYFEAGTAYEWLLKSVDNGINDQKYWRYQQHFEGIPVEDGIVVLIEMSGKISASGCLMKVDQHENSVVLEFRDAAQLAGFETDEMVSAPTLFWSPDSHTGIYRKVWKFTKHDPTGVDHTEWMIDAASGNIILMRAHRCYINSPGQAQTAYHGSCSITTGFDQGIYTLNSTNRGQGVFTKSLNHQLNYQSVSEFTDNDNHWDQSAPINERYATDAHYCAEQFYDFLQQKFNRNSIDNQGHPLKSYLNYGNGLVNAFWNGNAVVYGSGNQQTGPLTVIDIAGHEFTHGLIQKTANLNYSGESGIINEAISDIIGTAVEHYAFGSTGNWEIGERTGQTFRSMAEPNIYQQPASYLGNHWYYGTGDLGGVHINSGFINRWFYLLSIGDTGVSENGWNYSVTGIGINDAVQIVYHTLVAHLTPASGFNEFYLGTLHAAAGNYGVCSAQYLAVAEAWKAVGYSDYQTRAIELTVSDSTFCEGDSVLISWIGLPGSTYSLSLNGVQLINGTACDFYANESGSYQVSENRCGQILTSSHLMLSRNPEPEVTASNHTICYGQNVQLSGIPVGGSFNINNPYSGPATSYVYHYTDSNGCFSSAEGHILVRVPVDVNITVTQTAVPLNNDPILLEGNVSGVFSGTGVVGTYFNPSIAGIGGPYHVQLTHIDSSGCNSTGQVYFEVLKPCNRDTGDIRLQVTNSFINGQFHYYCTSNAVEDDFEYLWDVIGEHLSNGSYTERDFTFTSLKPGVTIQLTLTNTCKEKYEIIQSFNNKTEMMITAGPIPAKGSINVEIRNGDEQGATQVRLTDITGKVVLLKQLFGNKNHTISLDGITAGSYFLNFTNGKISWYEKILIMD